MASEPHTQISASFQDRWLTAFLTDDPDYAVFGTTLTLTRSSTTIVLEAVP